MIDNEFLEKLAEEIIDFCETKGYTAFGNIEEIVKECLRPFFDKHLKEKL